MRPPILILTLGLVLALALGACAPLTPAPGSVTPSAATPSATAAPRPTPAPSPTPRPRLGVDAATLRGQQVTLWHAWTGHPADVLARQADEFNRTNRWGITLTLVAQPDYNTLYHAVSAALEAKSAPDVVVALPEHALAWHAAAQVVDLNPFIGDPDYGWDAARAADFFDAVWAQDETAGARLAVPAARTARFLFYNQTWARQLGFDSPPLTAQDFRKQACAANATFRADADVQNDGLGGFLLDWHWQTALAWMHAFGGGALDESGVYAFDTPPNLAAFTFLTNLRAEGCAWYSTEADPFAALRERKALFIAASLEQVTDQLRAMRQTNSSDEWTLIPFPGEDGARAAVVYGPSYTLLDAGDVARQTAAWLAVSALLETDRQTEWVQATGTLPLGRQALDALDVYRGGRPQWGAAADALDAAVGVPHRASWRLVKLVLGDGFEDMLRTNLPPEQISPVTLQGMDALAQELEDGQ